MNPVPTPLFTASIERASPNRLAGEREMLTGQLDYHRATLLHKLEGLDDEQLRRQMTRSGLCLLGLVKHLAGTEQGWFLKIYAGIDEPDLYDPEADFRVNPDETVDGLVGLYLRTCQRAREVVATGRVDDVVTTPSGAPGNLRAILAHMIQETARHNGHADIIREAIDGATGQ
ncbi:DinB family protein [Actinopolymorpha sp. B11F2]|uniref:DinB family protein n=1 Tax=Actinopolymorpha sp. B11F2 TaxID=3160862 RepID=UPI0032E3FB76